MDIKKMEELGIADYYFDLNKFCHNFINKNYPLTTEDFKCLATESKVIEKNGELDVVASREIQLTDNIKKRQELEKVIKSEINKILEQQAKDNMQFLKDLEEKKDVKAMGIEQYKQQIFNYQQQILEKVWEFKNNSELFNSSLTQNDKESVKQSIEEGISPEAVNSILEDILNKTDEKGSIPKQAKEVVESIVEMKKDTENVVDESYASDFVRENNVKIGSAINDGISPDEITKTLVESANKANDRKSKKHLKFITKLITKMKVKELKLKKDKENKKGIQKVLK